MEYARLTVHIAQATAASASGPSQQANAKVPQPRHTVDDCPRRGRPNQSGAQHGKPGNKASRWTESSMYGMEPRYQTGFTWEVGKQSWNPSVEYTLCAEPLPLPPSSVFKDHDVADTLMAQPDLFKIVTPIDVDRFKWYLRPIRIDLLSRV
ncbi:hypothetical protein FRB90_006635 [Tulasnella sp. 427]|nr:hypothetical protein FRB90_006635 [Tulasnella sp. 427]